MTEQNEQLFAAINNNMSLLRVILINQDSRAKNTHLNYIELDDRLRDMVQAIWADQQRILNSTTALAA